MAGSLTNAWASAATAFVASGAHTLLVGGAIPGRLLFATVTINGLSANLVTIDPPAGWTAIGTTQKADQRGAAIFYRAASGGAADDFTVLFTGEAAMTARSTVHVAEISGMSATDPIIAVAAAENLGALNETQLSTGPLAPPQSDGTHFTSLGAPQANQWTFLTDMSDIAVSPLVSQDFTYPGYWPGANNRPGSAFGLRNHTDTNPVNFTWASGRVQGQVAVFNVTVAPPGGGPAPTVTPDAASQAQTADAAPLVLTYTLAPASASQAQTADAATLTPTAGVTPADVFQEQRMNGPPLVPEPAQAVLDRMAALSAQEIAAIRKFVNGLHADGIWQKIDEFYCFALNPTDWLTGFVSHTATITGTVNRTSNGAEAISAATSSHLDTSIDLGALSNYATTDAEVGLFVHTLEPWGQFNCDMFGVLLNDSRRTFLIHRGDDDLDELAAINSTGTATYPRLLEELPQTLHTMRATATGRERLLNGVLDPFIAPAPTAVPAGRTVYIFRINRESGLTTPARPMVATSFYVGGLIDTAQFYARLTTLHADLGVSGALYPDSASQAQRAAEAPLLVAASVVPDAAGQAQRAAEAELLPAASIIVDDAAQAQIAQITDLVQAHVLIPAAATQAQRAQIVDLVQDYSLTPAAATQAQVAEIARLGGLIVGAIKGRLLVYLPVTGELRIFSPITGELRTLN